MRPNILLLFPDQWRPAFIWGPDGRNLLEDWGSLGTSPSILKQEQYGDDWRLVINENCSIEAELLAKKLPPWYRDYSFPEKEIEKRGPHE